MYHNVSIWKPIGIVLLTHDGNGSIKKVSISDIYADKKSDII